MDLSNISDHDLIALRLLVGNYDLKDWNGCENRETNPFYKEMFVHAWNIHLEVQDEYCNRFFPCSVGNAHRKHRKVYDTIIGENNQEERRCYCSKCGTDLYDLYSEDSELETWKQVEPYEQ